MKSQRWMPGLNNLQVVLSSVKLVSLKICVCMIQTKLRNFFLLLDQTYPLHHILYEFVRAGKKRLRSWKAFYTCAYIQILTPKVLLPVHWIKTMCISIQKIFKMNNCGLKSLTHLFSPNIHWVVKIHAIDVNWHEGEYLLCVNEESLNIQWTFWEVNKLT